MKDKVKILIPIDIKTNRVIVEDNNNFTFPAIEPKRNNNFILDTSSPEWKPFLIRRMVRNFTDVKKKHGELFIDFYDTIDNQGTEMINNFIKEISENSRTILSCTIIDKNGSNKEIWLYKNLTFVKLQETFDYSNTGNLYTLKLELKFSDTEQLYG